MSSGARTAAASLLSAGERTPSHLPESVRHDSEWNQQQRTTSRRPSTSIPGSSRFARCSAAAPRWPSNPGSSSSSPSPSTPSCCSTWRRSTEWRRSGERSWCGPTPRSFSSPPPACRPALWRSSALYPSEDDEEPTLPHPPDTWRAACIPGTCRSPRSPPLPSFSSPRRCADSASSSQGSDPSWSTAR